MRQISARQAARKLVRRWGFDVLRSSDWGYRMIDHVAHLVRELDVNLVLDVGARFGDFADDLRRAGYRGRVVSFEPVTESFEILAKRAATDPEWHVARYAIGERDEQRAINVTEASELASFRQASPIGRATWGRNANVIKQELIEVRRLDSIFDRLADGLGKPRTFLKTDTQGWDLEVIRGVAGRIDTIQALMLEVHLMETYEGAPMFPDELGSVTALGLAPSGIFPISRTRSGAIHEADCVFVRPGALTE